MEQSLIPLREVASFTDRRATPCHRWQYMSTVTAPSPRNRVSPCSHLLIGFFFRDVLLDREVGAIYVLSLCADALEETFAMMFVDFAHTVHLNDVDAHRDVDSLRWG